jgi:hypothetical protein
MTRLPDIHCPPYAQPELRSEVTGSILALASRASAASNAYRHTMDARLSFRETMRAAGRLARATDELAAAIADAVACGDSCLS